MRMINPQQAGWHKHKRRAVSGFYFIILVLKYSAVDYTQAAGIISSEHPDGVHTKDNMEATNAGLRFDLIYSRY